MTSLSRAGGPVRQQPADLSRLQHLTRRHFLLKSSSALALTAVGGVLLDACGGSSSSSSGASTASGGGGSSASKTLTIAAAGAWQGFDVTNSAYIANGPSMEALAACAETLTQVYLPPRFSAATAAAQSGKLNGQPLLAKSWTISDKGSTYTFHLQPDAKSGYGNPLTSADVVWSIDRFLGSPTSVAAFLLTLCLVSKSSQVVAVDDHVVEFRLPSAPPVYFLQILGLVWLSIADSTEAKKHATKSDPYANKWMTTNIAGHGQYMIQSSVPNKTVILVPNPGYYGAKAAYGKIVQEGVDDQSARLQLLLTGTAQYAEELTPLQLTQVAKSSSTSVTPFTSTRSAFLVMNNTKPPFDKPEVRQAIARAIPYDSILASVYRGYAKLWKSAFVPWMQGSSDKYWDYETDAAAAAKGLASVKGTQVTLSYVEGFGAGQQIAVLIQQALNAAGLNCQLQGLNRALADKLKVTFQIPFFIDDSDSPAAPDALYTLQYLYTTKGFQNMARYSNSSVDSLTAQLAKVPAKNLAAQNRIIDKCNRLLMQELPYIPIAYTGTLGAEAKTLGGVGGTEVGLVYYPKLAA